MMKYIPLFAVSIIVSLWAISCAPKIQSTLPTGESNNAKTTTPQVSTPSSDEERNSPIRKIDFKNFSYIGPGGYSGPFTLKNGEKPFTYRKDVGISLTDVVYMDLTGDGQEEAILTMDIQSGGSMMPGLVFIYSTKNEKPRLLWKFETGDRANGGLKSIFGKDGNLIVELYGKTTLVKGSWETTTPKSEYCGDGCENIYTRSSLRWNGKVFEVQGDPEIFYRDPRESGGAWKPYSQ